MSLPCEIFWAHFFISSGSQYGPVFFPSYLIHVNQKNHEIYCRRYIKSSNKFLIECIEIVHSVLHLLLSCFSLRVITTEMLRVDRSFEAAARRYGDGRTLFLKNSNDALASITPVTMIRPHVDYHMHSKTHR